MNSGELTAKMLRSLADQADVLRALAHKIENDSDTEMKLVEWFSKHPPEFAGLFCGLASLVAQASGDLVQCLNTAEMIGILGGPAAQRLHDQIHPGCAHARDLEVH